MIIGIGGSKQVGKNTAAQVLVKKYGFTEMSFSYALKCACITATDLPYSMFESPHLKDSKFKQPFYLEWKHLDQMNRYLKSEWGAPLGDTRAILRLTKVCRDIRLSSPREIMQFVGTDLVRKYVDDDYWNNLMARQIGQKESVVITDVRFPGERRFVRGGADNYLIKISRPSSTSEDAHVSEHLGGSDDEYDRTFNNSGSISELHNAIEEWLLNDAIQGQERSGTPSGGHSVSEGGNSQPEEAAGSVQQASEKICGGDSRERVG